MRTTTCTAALFALALAFSACAGEGSADPTGAFPEAFEDGPPLNAVGGKTDGGEAIPAYAALPAGADLEQPLEVLFAPDDPTMTLEVELVDRVIAARLTDEAVYGEGDNPYRIRYAVYNLRNPMVVERLADAADVGVDVQVLIESHQLDPAKTWNTADETLTARGFELAPDHRQLDADERRSADLVGVVDSALMHLKVRFFETPGWNAVLSGSMNPGDNAVFNEETLHLVREPALIARYAAAYEAVLGDDDPPNSWDDDAAVNVLFTPAGSGPRAATKVLEWVEAEDEQILLMVFSLRDISAPGVSGSLVDILADKVAAGVPVVVVTDRKQSDGVDADGNPITWNDRTEDRLRAAGVHVYEATNLATPYCAMHHKVAVLGRTHLKVISDAANWTQAGLGTRSKKARNVESVLFIDSGRFDEGRIGRRYLAQFLRVLGRYAHQSAGLDGEPAYEDVAAELLGAPDWPTQSVWFAARDAFTDWGQEIAVVGDAAELGDWGRTGPGVGLTTDGELYPAWTTLEPVALPVGTTFEWKLVVEGSDGTIEAWEGGDNRRDLAAPATLLADPALVLEATWR